ncbi:mothers against decapentaplegic homolog 6-like isoform X3 [Pollicipes pollicipes]|uniref:mothers against decapentaplegic homolog 6-like isoform X3 n=1 Tax=Pollicipes pollicipes TaxID=41117 RepID=UPI0018856565|nr:mothers against decapentaplegic homolog 6-like isoform X3 [Pollicipes pollicipes]
MWKKLMQPIHRQRRIQRLIRLGVSDGVEAECAPEDSGVCATDSESERELVRSLLSTLHIDSLKMLCEAVESGGDSLGACVVVPKREYVLRSKCATAVVLFCRYFRWPDVDCELRLRRLLVCQCVQDDCQTCINPYHWSRVYTQVSDSPPPPVAGAKRSAPSARHQPDGSELAEPVSVTTGGTGQYGSTSSIDGASCRAWCRLFYFERRRRVGQLGGWAARGPVQHVFYSLPHGDGLALEAVVDQNPRPEPDVRQTRALIGAGRYCRRPADSAATQRRPSGGAGLRHEAMVQRRHLSGRAAGVPGAREGHTVRSESGGRWVTRTTRTGRC